MFKPQRSLESPRRSLERIPLSRIEPNPRQPRRDISRQSVAALASSIQQCGLLSPLLVRRAAEGRYELIAGERRLRALQLLDQPWAEAIVLGADGTDSALIALVENVQREALHYLDEAAACKRLLAQRAMSQEQLAASLSRSPSALANRLRLLKLPQAVQDAVRQFRLSERHARALLKLPEETAQLSLARQAGREGWSVARLEARIDALLKAPGDATPDGPSPAQPSPSPGGAPDPSRASPAPGGAPDPSRPAMPRHAKRRGQCPIVRDNRIIINALLDTVRELSRIGVRVKSRVEPRDDHVDVIVTIPASQGPSSGASP